MPEQYYQSQYTGEQIDEAVGKVLSGEAGGGVSDETAIRAENAAKRAEAATEHAPRIIDNTWWVWDAAANPPGYVNTGVSANGKPGPAGDPGISPTVSTADVTDGTEVTITDKDGQKSFVVKNGTKGDKGDEGDPGKNAYPGNWNQNDASASDYIQNRTHWVEHIVDEVLPEIIIGSSGYAFTDSLGLRLGGQYRVTFDGVEYDCTAESFADSGSTGVGIGRGYGMSGLDNSGNYLSFAILDYGDSTALSSGFTTQKAIKISSVTEVVHKLPDKFLPFPVSTAADAGKIPRVKADGSGYELVSLSALM